MLYNKKATTLFAPFRQFTPLFRTKLFIFQIFAHVLGNRKAENKRIMANEGRRERGEEEGEELAQARGGPPRSLPARLCTLARHVSTEPAMFLFMCSAMIKFPVFQQLLYEKACLQKYAQVLFQTRRN